MTDKPIRPAPSALLVHSDPAPGLPSKPTSSTIADLCKRHGFGVAFFYKMMAQGKGPRTVKIGRVRRVTDADEAAWLDQLRANADNNLGRLGKAGRPRKTRTDGAAT